MTLVFGFYTTQDALDYLRSTDPWPTWRYIPHWAYRTPDRKRSRHRRRKAGRA